MLYDGQKKIVNFVVCMHIALSSQMLFSVRTPSISPVPGQPFTTSSPGGIAYSPNNKWLASAASGGNQVSVFRVASNGSLQQIGDPFTTDFYILGGAAYSPDNQFLAVQGTAIDQLTGIVQLFSVSQSTGALTLFGDPATTIVASSSGQASFGGIAYASTGKFLIAANYNNGSTGSLTSFKLNSNGSLGSSSTTTTGHIFNSLVVNQITLSPDNRFLATANADTSESVSVFSVNPLTGALTNQHNYSLDTGTGNILTSVAYSPTGKFLAVVDNVNTLVIYSVDSISGILSNPVATTISHVSDGAYQTVAFSPDGQCIAVGQYDYALSVFTINSRGTVTPFITSPNPLLTGNAPVGITFSPINTVGVSFLSIANYYDATINSYAFTLMQPMGPLAAAIRSKYLFDT